MEVHKKAVEPWRVTLVDTGAETMTGGRLKRVEKYIRDDEFFCFTYGDGVSDVDITSEIRFHKQSGLLATVAAVQPPGRYGSIISDGDLVSGFREKPAGDGGWINGGFFVLSPKVLELIGDDAVSWEEGPMEKLAADGQLAQFRHHGFWQAMDTLRDKNNLEQLWSTKSAPWVTWK